MKVEQTKPADTAAPAAPTAVATTAGATDALAGTTTTPPPPPASPKPAAGGDPDPTLTPTANAASPVARLAGCLTPEQLAFVCMETAKGNTSLEQALTLVLPVQHVAPEAFRLAVDGIFKANGGPAASSTTPGKAPTDATTANASGGGAELTAPPPTGPAAAAAVAAMATADAADADDGSGVSEIVVLCVDVSGSMQTPFEVDADASIEGASNPRARVKDRTRLDAVKQMFYGFRDQTAALASEATAAVSAPPGTAANPSPNPKLRGRRHELGLVSYSSTATVHTAPTTNYAVFEDTIDDLEPAGCTAIYEAITTACKLLAPAAARYAP